MLHNDLSGRRILITGASRGLGRAIADACLHSGASVFLAARDSSALDAVREDLQQRAASGQIVASMAADISSVLQIQMLAGIAIQTLGGLDGVVNNAGMLGPKGLVEQTDPGDWMDTLQTNLLGPVMLCQAVLPLFRRRGYGKIVNLSGGGATAPMPRLSAYAASKAALVRFTETLAEETRGSGIDVNAVAPGALRTRMTKEAVEAGPKAVGADFFERMKKVQSEGGAPLEDAAALCAFLLSSASDGITGKLISAVWDNWQLLPERRGGLDASDVYTLRRIVPRDRGLDWE